MPLSLSEQGLPSHPPSVLSIPQVFGFFATIVFAIDFYLIFNDVAKFLKQGGSAEEPTANKEEGGWPPCGLGPCSPLGTRGWFEAGVAVCLSPHGQEVLAQPGSRIPSRCGTDQKAGPLGRARGSPGPEPFQERQAETRLAPPSPFSGP